MVIPDWGANSRPVQFTQDSLERLQLARPMDRLGALIVDIFILLAPVFILLSAPLKRWLTTSWVLALDSDIFLSITLLGGLAILLLVAYQTISHFVLGATLGKRLFGLRVQSVFVDEEPTLWDCFFRSCLWVIELLCLGLPWLSVFSDDRRRPLHDRACDTVVVAQLGNGVAGPLHWHRGAVRGIYGAVFALAALTLFIEFQGMKEKMNLEHSLLGLEDKESALCEAVSPYIPEENEDQHARLNMSMLLYAAGLAERSCLEAEVDRETSLQVPPSSATYLAQAFVYADDADVSNSYLDKVCKDAPDSVECSMSQLVSDWSDDDWSGVENIIRSAPKGSGYLEIWGVRHFMKQAQYADALTMLDSLVDRREVREFSLTQRVKALFNTYRDSEAQAALAQAVVALPKEDSVDLSAWVCAQQLQNGCEALSSIACRQTPTLSQGDPIDFNNSPEALAQVLAMECKSVAKMDYQGLSEQSAEDDGWQTFFRANFKQQKDDRVGSAALYSKVIGADSTPDILRVEATRRLLQFASPRQIENIVQMWAGFESKEAWVKTGNLLFSHLAAQKNSELALRVARHLMNSHALSPKGMTALTAMVDGPASGREPASVKVRDQVRQLLESMGSED